MMTVQQTASKVQVVDINPDFTEGVAKGAEWRERALAQKRRRWRKGALKVQPTVQKRPRWRKGALSMSRAALNALQRMVDEINDIYMVFIIQHVQQYYPECILGDDGNEIEFNPNILTQMKQQRLAKYIGHISDWQRINGGTHSHC